MSLSRRQMMFSTAGGALVLGLALHKSERVAYRLEALCTCRKCKACREHANHKWFATPDAVQRAHLHCKCRVLAVRVSERQYADMFNSAAHFDQRKHERLV